MITEWGYSKDKLAATAWAMPDSPWYGPQAASVDTEARIDKEIKELGAEAYKHCKATLTENRDLVEELTEMLIEYETVDYKQMQELVSKKYPDGIPGDAGQGLMIPKEERVALA